MADISIMKNHNLDMDTARTRLEGVAVDLNKKYGIKSTWTGNTCSLSGTGLKKGTLELKDSSISIEITLGMLAKAMKGKIKEQIDAQFTKVLS